MASTREKLNNLHPLLRWLLYILLGLLVLLIILQLFLTFYADDYAATKIKEQVRSSGDIYSIEFDDLDLNVFSGSAAVSNLRINADTTAFSDSSDAPSMVFKGKVGKVDVSGINVLSTAWGNELKVGSLTITGPELTAVKNPHGGQKKSGDQSPSSIDSTILAAISERYSALEIDEFAIRDGRARITVFNDTVSSIGKVDLNLENIRVDSASAASGRLFVTKDFSLDARHFRTKLADSLNIIAFKRLSVSSGSQSLSMDSLELIPRYSKLKFAWRHGTRIDRIDLTIPKIKVEKIDFSRLVDSTKFYAGYLEISDASLKDYMNQGVPGGPPRKKTLPFVTFKNMEQQVKIDSLNINNSFISYSEYHSEAPQAGTVSFEELDATFKDISNYPEDKASGLTTTLDVRTRVMGSGLLNVHFEFPMDTQNGFHKIRGNLDSMSITDFNEMTRYVASVRINQGLLNSLEFDMTLNEDRSNGDVIMNYENLKFSVIDLQSQKQKGLKENVITFVGNNLLVKKNNTPETGMQAGRINFERDKTKSIFNYWWKSLLSGIKDSAKK